MEKNLPKYKLKEKEEKKTKFSEKKDTENHEKKLCGDDIQSKV